MTILNYKSGKIAFTLAEVLITLAIIGVVAAMTIPNLIQSYKKSVIETRLAKFYSVMNNAIRMAEVDYGPQNTWSDYYEDDEYDDDHKTLYEKGEKYDAHVNKYFAPYIKIVSSEEIRDVTSSDAVPQKIYYLADSTAFGFSLHENREIWFYPYGNPKKCLIDKKHLCKFNFVFMPTGGLVEYKLNHSNGMQPAKFNFDEEKIKNPCTKDSCPYVLERIRRNGWKISKDILDVYKL